MSMIIKFPKSKNEPEKPLIVWWKLPVLWDFWNDQNWQFFDFEIFKELELGSWFFKSSKNRPRLVFILHIIHSLVSTIPYLLMWFSGWLIIYCHICGEERGKEFVLDKNFICSFLSNKFSFKTQRDLCTFIGFHGHNFVWLMIDVSSWLSLDWCHR
jgi:hypothetical protein